MGKLLTKPFLALALPSIWFLLGIIFWGANLLQLTSLGVIGWTILSVIISPIIVISSLVLTSKSRKELSSFSVVIIRLLNLIITLYWFIILYLAYILFFVSW